MSYTINVDEKSYKVDVDANTPLLWVLRDELNITGVKFGCGVSQCGACTVLVEGKATRACQTPIEKVNKLNITTIETKTDSTVKKLQKFWVQEDVAQCGYCQSGQIINAAGLLKLNPNPSEDEIIKAMNGNICRCGTYSKIKTAINLAVKEA